MHCNSSCSEFNLCFINNIPQIKVDSVGSAVFPSSFVVPTYKCWSKLECRSQLSQKLHILSRLSAEQKPERDQGIKSVWENHPCSLSPYWAPKWCLFKCSTVRNHSLLLPYLHSWCLQSFWVVTFRGLRLPANFGAILDWEHWTWADTNTFKLTIHPIL